jgi:hypothetical protein
MGNIVQRIQSDILKPEINLSSILLAAKVMAHELNNQKLMSWVSYESDGYPSTKQIPDYRILTPPSKGTFTDGYTIVKNKIIPMSMIHDDWLRERVIRFPVSEGIRGIEDLAMETKVALNSPWADELVQLLNHEGLSEMLCVEASFVLNSHQFAQILHTVRSRLLDFVLEIENLDWHSGKEQPSNEQIQRLVEVKILNNPAGGNMSLFDQRGQNVNYQYNAAGNINIEAIQNQSDLVEELGKLKYEIEKAKLAGAIDEDDAIDAEYQIQKAIQEAKKSEPDKKSFVEHIGKAKELLEDTTAAAGLVTALLKAVKIAKDLL